MGPLRASVVENRWNHLWWIDTEERVRFFRPLVFASYWLDAALWAERYEVGLLAGNLALYVLCVVLVWHLARRWLGDGLPAVLAGALFAAFFCHGEVIWYVAGRTDSLAAAGFLGALALHRAGGERAAARYLAVPLYGLALLTKETVIFLPLACFLHDLWVERREAGAVALARSEARLWVLYLGTAVAVRAAGWAALGGRSSDAVFPYFVAPSSPGFTAHLWTQLRAYGENLVLATPTAPFLQPERLSDFTSAVGLALTAAAAAAVAIPLRRDPRAWFFAGLLVLTWLPTSIAYVSERYLLLPSAAVALLAGLALEKLAARRYAPLAVAAICVWIVHQAWWLRQKNTRLMERPRASKAIARQVEENAERLAGRRRLLLVDLPGDIFQAQFAESQLRVVLRDPELEVTVLTVMPLPPRSGAGTRFARLGERAFRLVGASPNGGDRFPFPRYSLAPGASYRAPRGVEVRVAGGDGSGATSLDVYLPLPLAAYEVLAWRPAGGDGIAGGRLEFLTD